nr:unnamed protein product [Callosobruchus chinensis]CAH7761180.1 unnamed protein product [Callosobruchus chinensis]
MHNKRTSTNKPLPSSKHARRHPNFDPSILRQRRAPNRSSGAQRGGPTAPTQPPDRAFSINSSDGTPSEVLSDSALSP